MPHFQTDPEAFRLWRAEPANWLPLVAQIARAEGIPADGVTAFPTGTNLVVALDDQVILKIFPPIYRRQVLSEKTTLRQLHGRLDIPIPALLAEGAWEDWSYLAISRLPGILGSSVWDRLAEDQKERILRQIGETIAQVQACPLGELGQIEPRWADFIARQIEGCLARHRRLGLPARFLDDLQTLLDEAPDLVPAAPSPVILTGEYIPENFLLAETDGRWDLAGLIDFGDVMTGWGEYDLLGPGAFMAAGRPGRIRALLEGYGYAPGQIDPTLPRRLLILMLLHRASNLGTICIEGWEDKIGSLQDLGPLVWANI
ncbi:MAG: phosphotransferase [Alphaproteobacteria bacterium]|nr:phosphotransferase [Alphaproteobacteria bacterium]MBU0797334.1 phosphotransferase [Alphaproteobacteria bacterium]MBU0886898.1 phosphotransferase [Alphaproteobacteria bacterium]MBU1812359.1 phosphotransferase [Alphaproteobacteria bacterium]MBU2090491.1 phosphotransferase [Alphaproteobacteria bacterium]